MKLKLTDEGVLTKFWNDKWLDTVCPWRKVVCCVECPHFHVDSERRNVILTCSGNSPRLNLAEGE